MTTGADYTRSAIALSQKHADEIRESWQARALLFVREDLDEELAARLLCMLAHSYYEAMDILVRICWPGFKVEPPCLTGVARIAVTGNVVCNMWATHNIMREDVEIFRNEGELIATFRGLADTLKLNDRDRRALFGAVQHWVSRDDRIAPSVEYSGRA